MDFETGSETELLVI